MNFTVADECLQLGLRAGAIIFRDVRVSASPPELRTEIVRESLAIRERLADVSAVRSLPPVIAFADLLRKVGVNPRRDQPSVERLLSFALRRGDLPRINSLVDAYNLVSVRTGCSLGAHDLDRLALPVRLRLLTGNETFTPLGGSTPVPITAGEYAYVDGANRVLCRLDILQAEFSKVIEATRNALLIVEGTAFHAPESLHQAFNDVIELVTRHCGGTAEAIAPPCT